ncbi:unnamed protein product [Spodoptera exigua]|nr:unnamed protein product [Spodoptera exigua]
MWVARSKVKIQTETAVHYRASPRLSLLSRGCGVNAMRHRDLGPEQEKKQGGFSQSANEQTDYLMVSNQLRPRTPATTEELRVRCRPFRDKGFGDFGKGNGLGLRYQGPMKSGSQKECVVTGTLCLMLRMSQLAGVAPIRFRRMHGGWCIRVSRLANFYGKSLSFMLWLLSTTTIAMDILIEPERSYRTRTNSTRIVWVADVGTVGLVVCTAAFTGFSRTKCLMVYLLKLQEINLKLSLYHDEPSNESARKLIAVSSMIFTSSTILLDFGIYIYQVAVDHGKSMSLRSTTITNFSGSHRVDVQPGLLVKRNKTPASACSRKMNGRILVMFTSCMYIFYNISTAVQQVILITFSETATGVYTSLLSLNNCLKNLLEQIVHDSPEARNSILNQDCRIDIYNTISSKSINSVVDTMTVYRARPKPPPHPLPIMIRRLGLLYCSLCDVVRDVNDSYGTVLVAMLLCLLLHLVITPYHVITNIYETDPPPNQSDVTSHVY